MTLLSSGGTSPSFPPAAWRDLRAPTHEAATRLSGRRSVQGCSGADQRLEGILIYFIALMEIDSASGAAFKAGVASRQSAEKGIHPWSLRSSSYRLRLIRLFSTLRGYHSPTGHGRDNISPAAARSSGRRGGAAGGETMDVVVLQPYPLRQVAGFRPKLEQRWLSPIGPGGFEPPLTDPKSAVLPFDEGPAAITPSS